MTGVLYGGVQEKCPGRHIIITTGIYLAPAGNKINGIYILLLALN